jgi:hypothetical protein
MFIELTMHIHGSFADAPPGDNLRLQWHGGTHLATSWQFAAKF